MISQRIEGTSAVAIRGATGVPNAYPMLSSRHIRNQTRCSPPPADDNRVRLLHSGARKGATYARLAGIISYGADRGARLLALRFKNAIEGRARHSRASNFERRRAKRFAFDCPGGANLLGGPRFLCVARRAVLQRDARRAKIGTRRLHLLGGNKFGRFHRDRALRCGSHTRVLKLCRRSIDASPSHPIILRGTSTRRSSLTFPARPQPTFLLEHFPTWQRIYGCKRAIATGFANDVERGCAQTAHREEKQNA